ncbi:MAG: PKD domain-containing protein [Candidatus Brocadiaceae bacterium]|jgi:hypothetical protein
MRRNAGPVSVFATVGAHLRGAVTLSVLSLLTLPTTAPATGATVDYSDGFDGAAMALNAGAAVVDGHLRLTDTSSGGQSRSAYHRHKVPVDRFVTKFTYRASRVRSNPCGGWTFALQNQGLDAVGRSKSTGTCGWAPTKPSIALRMTAGCSMMLVKNTARGGSEEIKGGPMRPEVGDFRSGDPFEFLLAYDGAVLHLVVTNRRTGDSYYQHFKEGREGGRPLEIGVVLGADTAWAGFTAGTGSKEERRYVQEVETWSWWADEREIPPVAGFELNALSPCQALNGNVVRARAPYEVRFAGDTSFDVDGSVVRYEWDFGDGETAESPRPSARHVYERAGSYDASLVVVDEDGNRSHARCIRIVVGEALEAVIEPTRTGGVAPLCVFFDGTKTAGLAGGDFLNARFAWDFDVEGTDPDGRYEHGEGFVAAHVFEQPGTYRVRLAVTDVSGEKATAETEVKVDPVDASWTTYHVASDGDDANPGTLQRPKKTLRRALEELAGPKVRIRLRRGDTWRLDQALTLSADGPVIVDSYGAPSDALPLIRGTWVDGAYRMIRMRGSDWRLMHVAVLAGSNSYRNPRQPGGVHLSGRDNLVAGVQFSKLGSYISPLYGVRNAIYDSFAADAGPYFVYGSRSRKFAIIGNDVEVESDHDEHVIRFQGGHKGYIAHNKLRAKKTKSNVQLRGDTSQVVVFDNDFFGRGSGPHPQNDASEEYAHHIVFEGNRFLYEPAYEGTRFAAAGTAVGVKARHVVIRNNLAVNYGRLFAVGAHCWVGPSVNVRVYNNTVYADDTGGVHSGLLCSIYEARLVTVRNNLVFNTVTTPPKSWVRLLAVSEKALETLRAGHNLYWAPAWDDGEGLVRIDGEGLSLAQWRDLGFGQGTLMTDPLLTSTDRAGAEFMRLRSESPAIDAGAAVPVFIDLAGNSRPEGEARDIGAFEYPAGGGGS